MKCFEILTVKQGTDSHLPSQIPPYCCLGLTHIPSEIHKNFQLPFIDFASILGYKWISVPENLCPLQASFTLLESSWPDVS